MRFHSGTAPNPQPAPQTPRTPGPEIVPAPEPVKRRKIWGIFLILAAVAAGTAYYLTRGNYAALTGGGPPAVIQTVVADMGNVHTMVRVHGAIAARNQETILAPRIQGSRQDANRGGTANFNDRGGHGGGGGVGGGGGGPQGLGAAQMHDFSLVLIYLAPAGSRVKAGDVVAKFDPQMQQQRLDDYRDSLIQLDANISRMIANLGANRESHAQRVRLTCAQAQQALLDQQTKPVVSAINGQLYDLAVEETAAKCKQLEYEDALVDEQQRAQIRATELRRDQSQLELKRSEANVERMTIRAKTDGIVVMASIVRNNEFGQVREGDEVHAGQPFMYVVDPTTMILSAKANQVDAELLRLGMKARIQLDAYNDLEVPGTLEGIGALSKTSTFRARYVSEIPIRVRLDGMDTRIIPDLTASAEVYTETETNALVLPRTAVFKENGSHFVFLQRAEGWFRQPVEVGLLSFTHAAVRSGVQKGDVVANQRPM